MLVMFNANNEFVTVIANKDPTETMIANIARSFGLNPSEVIVEKYDFTPVASQKIIFDANRKLQEISISTEEVKTGEDKNQVAILEMKKVATVLTEKTAIETKYTGSGRG